MTKRLPVHSIDATGTRSSTTYLRGDATWATPAGGGGAAAQSYVGKSTAGASGEVMVTRRTYLKQVTLTQAGLLTDVGAYINGNGNVHGLAFGVWADNAGVPDKILGFTSYPAASSLYLVSASEWVSSGIGRWLAAGTYWLGVQFRLTTGGTGWTLAYDAAGGDRTFTPSGDWIQGLNGVATTAASRDYSIRGNLITL